MNPSTLKLKIKRCNPEKTPPSWEEAYEVEPRKGMNLLEALLRIQDEQDSTLSFRYSCRGAVCGSCAMKVNGELVLACRTPVERLLGRTTLIEPLPNFPVIRDLVVDMSLFFKHYRQIKPYLHEKPATFDRESLMKETEREGIDPYTQCILCGICFGACPAFGREGRFLGPAILAKAYRFLLDPRDRRKNEILESVNHHQGVWGCNTVFRCVKVCPKEVPPTHAILSLRSGILKTRLASFFSRLSRVCRGLSKEVFL
jgi:succinate dehydrogenase / fumarate reductase iron-sulfur subunit